MERLIVEGGVDTFLFGSRSKFDELCHIVVTEFQEMYPHIRRIAYLCKHEAGCLAGEGKDEQCRIRKLTGRDVYIPEYEDIKRSDRVNSAGRACYVERNYWMIEESHCLVLYCDEGIKLKSSGTKLVWKYAKRKESISIFNLL